MGLRRFNLAGRRRWYLARNVGGMQVAQALSQTPWMQHLERVSSSHFYLEPVSNSLFKISRDKYSPRAHFWRWLSRDIISKRLAGGLDALKEYLSNRTLARLGQRTIDVRLYGVALNPFNPLGSLYAMEFLADCSTGREYFERLDEKARVAFMARFCDLVIELAEAGFYHRDLHLTNIMVDEAENIIWIDTHIKRLPKAAAERTKILDKTLIPYNFYNEKYMEMARRQLIPHFS